VAESSRQETEDGGPPAKKCFVVSAFGATEEDRTRTQQVLHHLVRKVLTPLGYDVVRADDIEDEGLITHQVIEHLLEDDLVIADLTGRNPNVFYELAVRHAARRPVIHLITRGESIPFDIANIRAISYALDDPDLLERAQQELARKVTTIERNPAAAENPISTARDIWLLRNSDQPETRGIGEILGAVTSLREEMRALGRRVDHQTGAGGGPRRAPNLLGRAKQREILRVLHDSGPMPMRDLERAVRLDGNSLRMGIGVMQDEGLVFRDADGVAITSTGAAELEQLAEPEP
jgi:hypothetical protein